MFACDPARGYTLQAHPHLQDCVAKWIKMFPIGLNFSLFATVAAVKDMQTRVAKIYRFIGFKRWFTVRQTVDIWGIKKIL